MKKIIILHSTMEIGGAETSLLGLLHSFDYKKVEVDLFLYQKKGELLSMIPKEVNILESKRSYEALMLPIKEVLISRKFPIAIARITGRLVCCAKNKKYNYSDYGYIVKQRAHLYALPFLEKIPGEYDLAISFNDPHYIMDQKINAKKKMGWFHTDFSRITPDKKLENAMWEKCDYIVNVSDACKKQFDLYHPKLEKKSIVIENIMSEKYIKHQAKEAMDESEMSGKIKLLSIGRFCEAKNFDNVPEICKRIVNKGLDVKWYLIGYGTDENLIREKIREFGMEENVIILGKKCNPYPYIVACDIYVQPSRYEGKAVTVREAQMLNKVVVITEYSTAQSQLDDRVDGIIVPLDNEGCAIELANIITDQKLQEKVALNTRGKDYSNIEQVNKIYGVIGNVHD